MVAPGDVVAQSRAMMERLSVVLARLDADFGDVVKLNVFYVGGGDAETWAVPAKIRAGFFPEPGPAATGVPLEDLGQAGLMTRISVTAMRDPAGKRMAKSFSWPDGHWDWTTHLPYKHANRCGRMIHVGGQVSLDGKGGVIDPDDMAAQTRRSMDYIEKALAELGAGLDDVVKVTAFYQGGASAARIHENPVDPLGLVQRARSRHHGRASTLSRLREHADRDRSDGDARLTGLIPAVLILDPLRRSDFVRWQGARCAVVPPHFKQRATRPADKSTRPFGWGISPRRGRYARLPDGTPSRCATCLPGRDDLLPRKGSRISTAGITIPMLCADRTLPRRKVPHWGRRHAVRRSAGPTPASSYSA